jgi:hypothetical protein
MHDAQLTNEYKFISEWCQFLKMAHGSFGIQIVSKTYCFIAM